MDKEASRRTLNMVDISNSQPMLEANPIYPEMNLGDPKPVMTEPMPILRGGRSTPCTSPIISGSPAGLGVHVPSPIITKRTRTNSTYERAMDNPIERGYIKYFSRSKGHGFIVSERVGEEVFVHVSDIEGEYVPCQRDEVTYRLCPIPPKLEKFQAIHCRIVNFTPEVHLKWDSPLNADEKSDESPDYLVT